MPISFCGDFCDIMGEILPQSQILSACGNAKTESSPTGMFPLTKVNQQRIFGIPKFRETTYDQFWHNKWTAWHLLYRLGFHLKQGWFTPTQNRSLATEIAALPPNISRHHPKILKFTQKRCWNFNTQLSQVVEVPQQLDGYGQFMKNNNWVTGGHDLGTPPYTLWQTLCNGTSPS